LARGLAIPVTPTNLKKLQQEKERLAEEQERAKKEAQDKKARLDGFSVTIQSLVKEEDKLYAGIDAQDIAAALKDEGFEVGKKFVVLDEPIKSLGIYEVPIKLHMEVTAKIKVWVVKK
jgi:large subunit ribosomal protein L9